MTTLEEITTTYVTAYTKYKEQRDNLDSKIERREKQIQRLKKRREKLVHPSWIDTLIKPIAEELVKNFPDRYYEILGPFGLGAEVPIHFYKKNATEKTMFKGKNCKSITFRPGDLDKGELRIVDQSTNTHKFEVGTIGEMNGFNHPDVAIKPDSDLIELVKWIR